jgi:hypothetical protein
MNCRQRHRRHARNPVAAAMWNQAPGAAGRPGDIMRKPHRRQPPPAVEIRPAAGEQRRRERLPAVKKLRPDPYSEGRRAFERGDGFEPDFGLRFPGWGTISAQCLYEAGRLAAAEQASRAGEPKRRSGPAPASGKRQRARPPRLP